MACVPELAVALIRASSQGRAGAIATLTTTTSLTQLLKESARTAIMAWPAQVSEDLVSSAVAWLVMGLRAVAQVPWQQVVPSVAPQAAPPALEAVLPSLGASLSLTLADALPCQHAWQMESMSRRVAAACPSGSLRIGLTAISMATASMEQQVATFPASDGDTAHFPTLGPASADLH